MVPLVHADASLLFIAVGQRGHEDGKHLLSAFTEQLLARGADAKAGAGSLFGLVPAPGGAGVYFVDDAANALKLLH